MGKLDGKVVVVTGAARGQGAAEVAALAVEGATVVATDLLPFDEPAADGVVQRTLDVTDEAGWAELAAWLSSEYGRVDALVNGAGGNDPRTTTNPENRFFDIPIEAFQQVLSLNLVGTVIPTQAFGRLMAEQKEGVILNVSSVNASRPLTRIAAYSAAKAGVSNLTQWLAVHMAQEYSPHIRVNALMPGFFLTEQNRFLLTDQKTGALTARGQKIMDHTPMGRFGAPEDLSGALIWLLSPASRFVTGVVVAVDGGFTAYSGV